jgi:hypothetical protein
MPIAGQFSPPDRFKQENPALLFDKAGGERAFASVNALLEFQLADTQKLCDYCSLLIEHRRDFDRASRISDDLIQFLDVDLALQGANLVFTPKPAQMQGKVPTAL